jgi:hypothetical protein
MGLQQLAIFIIRVRESRIDTRWFDSRHLELYGYHYPERAMNAR